MALKIELNTDAYIIFCCARTHVFILLLIILCCPMTNASALLSKHSTHWKMSASLNWEFTLKPLFNLWLLSRGAKHHNSPQKKKNSKQNASGLFQKTCTFSHQWDLNLKQNHIILYRVLVILQIVIFKLHMPFLTGQQSKRDGG